MNDGIRVETKVEITWHDVAVFVLAQLPRSRWYRLDITQGRRDIKVDHRGQATICGLNLRRLRIALSRRTVKREERKRDADKAKKDAD